jgi:hypothetical protein
VEPTFPPIFKIIFLQWVPISGYGDARKQLSSISLKFELMSPQIGMDDSNDKNRRTKPTAAIPVAGAVVIAALLLSGLSFVSNNNNYQPAIAQEQNVIEGGGGGDGAAAASDNTTSAIGGATQDGNTTTTGGASGANQSTSEVRMNLEQARIALQNNDTQSAMMFLDMALNTMDGGGGGTQSNVTSTTASGGNATTGSEEGVSVGGTSAADDYDETADADG